MFGSTQYNPPSRFLDEIPTNLVTMVAGERRTARGQGASSGSYGNSSYGGSSYGGRTPGSGGAWGRRDADEDWSGSVIGGGGRSRGGESIESALKPPPPTQSGADQIGLQVGDDVSHGKFGDGVITAIVGSGDKAEAVVNFRGIGEKRLLLAWAPLTKR